MALRRESGAKALQSELKNGDDERGYFSQYQSSSIPTAAMEAASMLSTAGGSGGSPRIERTGGLTRSGSSGTMMDYFSDDIFHAVLHNPTTSYRFTKYCRSRACEENIEFIEKVGHFSHIRTLDYVAFDLQI